MEAVKYYGGPIPASLKKFAERNADKIEMIGNEGEDGFWLYLRKGFWTGRFEQTHSIREDDPKDLIKKFKWAVEPCTCPTCK